MSTLISYEFEIYNLTSLSFCVYLSVFHCYCHIFWQIYISVKKKIMTQNFQDIILWVYQCNPCCHGWPFPLCVLSKTLDVNILYTPLLDLLFLAHFQCRYQHKNSICDIKNDHVKVSDRNPQHPPSTPMKDSSHTSNEDISMKLSRYLP